MFPPALALHGLVQRDGPGWAFCHGMLVESLVRHAREGGRVAAAGRPAEVMTAPLLSRAYRCELCLNTAPREGVWLLPQVARAGG